MEKNNSSLSVIPISSIFLVLSMIGAFLVYELPLKGVRPSKSETKEHHVVGCEDVDARLWQDPFSAVARHGKGERHKIESLCEQITKKYRDDNREVVILGVMTPGSPYDETAELRLRWRYAGVSALSELKYVPEDSQHIGYFEHNFEGDYCDLCRRYVPNPPLFEMPANPSSTCDVDGSIKIPYEWYLHAGTSSALLLLWLDDEAFQSQPMQKLANLVKSLRSRIRDEKIIGKIQFKILGPTGSDDLKAMIEDVKHCEHLKDDSLSVLKSVQIYSPFATADDGLLLGNGTKPVSLSADGSDQEGKNTVSNYFSSNNLSFVRTIGSDKKLCKSIFKELKLRNVDVANTDKEEKNRHHIVLVAEWDSFYGRYLRQSFIDAVTEWTSQKPGWIHWFSYLRGIDGQLPNQPTADTGGTERQEKTQKTEKDIKAEMYRPTGRNQFDYLLGLAHQITYLSETLKHDGEGEIKAIGVLGSDVYDKLLVLQALRPQFPNAVFFTTDMDASLLQPSEYKWARNLVVVSNFGLVLNENIQKTVPPFRDNYQTSLFFTTVLALSKNDVFLKDNVLDQNLIDQYLSPRIFEVGRRGAVELFTEKQKKSKIQSTINVTTMHIHPPLKEPFSVTKYIWFLPGILLLLALIYVTSDSIKRIYKAYWGIGFTMLLTSALFVTFFKKWGLYLEPFSLFDGVSIWPTVILRVLVFLLSVCFTFNAYKSLQKNHEEIEKQFCLTHKVRQPIVFYDRFRLPFWWGNKKENNTVESLWDEYCKWGLPSCRLARTTMMCVLYFSFFVLSSQLLSEGIFTPARGASSFAINTVILWLAVIAMLFLIFFVGDAARLCRKFIQCLADCNTEQFWDCRPKVDGYKEYYNKVTLIAQHTEAVGGLVFYPFIAFSIMAASRIPYFDSWNVPLVLMFIYTVLGIYIFSSAYVLQRETKKARDHILAKLHNRYMGVQQGADKEQLKLVIDMIDSIQDGAFKPLLQQPLFMAILIPFSAGGMELINYFVKW